MLEKEQKFTHLAVDPHEGISRPRQRHDLFLGDKIDSPLVLTDLHHLRFRPRLLQDSKSWVAVFQHSMSKDTGRLSITVDDILSFLMDAKSSRRVEIEVVIQDDRNRKSTEHATKVRSIHSSRVLIGVSAT
jgi:hypothetical protein